MATAAVLGAGSWGTAFAKVLADAGTPVPEAARIIRIHGDPAAAQHWQLVSFSPASDVSGAVVIEGHQLEISFWDAAAE